MGLKCNILFSGPPKGISLRETASFDILIVKIGAGVLVTICSGVSEGAGVEFPTFPLTCVVVLETPWH